MCSNYRSLVIISSLIFPLPLVLESTDIAFAIFILKFLPEILKHEKKDITENNDVFIKQVTRALKEECGSKETKKLNKKWAKDYKKMGYIFLSRENIFKKVCSIL